jgi:hypothetical protein
MQRGYNNLQYRQQFQPGSAEATDGRNVRNNPAGDGSSWTSAGVGTFTLALLIAMMATAILVIVAIDLSKDQDTNNVVNSISMETSDIDSWALCDDGNVCTVDSANEDDGCINRNMWNDSPCNSSCYVNGTGLCQRGVCVGSKCAGQCNVPSDCPAIPYIGLMSNLDAQCIYSTCIYNAEILIGKTVANSNAYMCTDDGKINENLCLGLIDSSSPSKKCLTTQFNCTEYTIRDITPPFNVVGYDNVLVCNFGFGCAVPIFP